MALFLISILFLVSILMCIYGVGQMLTYMKMSSSDPVPVQDLNPPEDSVELSGTARTHEDTSQTPFTEQDTLICEWEVERYDPHDDGSNWENVDSGEMKNSFLIDDGTGSVLVDPTGASLYMRETQTIYEDDDSFEVSAFLDSAGIEIHSGRDRRYRESHLGPGDDVHVMGSVRPPTDDLPDSIVGVVRLDDQESSSGLSSVVEAFEPQDFTISNAGEDQAETEVLKYAALFLGIGGIFFVISILLFLN